MSPMVPTPGISGSALLLGLKFQPRLQDDNSLTNMQFHGHTMLPRNSRGVQVRGKGQNIRPKCGLNRISQSKFHQNHQICFRVLSQNDPQKY